MEKKEIKRITTYCIYKAKTALYIDPVLLIYRRPRPTSSKALGMKPKLYTSFVLNIVQTNSFLAI